MSGDNQKARSGGTLDAKIEELLGLRGKKERHAVRHGELPEAINSLAKVQYKKVKAAINEARTKYGAQSFEIAQTTIAAANDSGNPVTLMSSAIEGFEETGFSVTIHGFFDNMSTPDAWGVVRLSTPAGFNNVARMGMRAASSTVGETIAMSGRIPFSLSGVYNTPGPGPTINIEAWAQNASDPDNADLGFVLRSLRVSIAGIS